MIKLHPNKKRFFEERARSATRALHAIASTFPSGDRSYGTLFNRLLVLRLDALAQASGRSSDGRFTHRLGKGRNAL